MTETIKSAKELARFNMSKGIPTYIEGPPGVGKSEMWLQIANEEKIGFIDLRLAQMDPVDLRGLPSLIKTKDGLMTTWARPDVWPLADRDGPKGIILFDELGDCSKAMQSAAYQPILNGWAGPHQIGDGWYRAAAGNAQKHRAGAQAMSTALANRFAWIEVEADVECFYEHGTRMGYHHYVLSFLKHCKPGLLFSMEGGNSKAFCSPRSWYRASLCCDAPAALRFRLVGANVGEGAAGELEGYLRTLDLPTLEEVLRDPKRCHIPNAPSSKYALASMLARYATEKNFEHIIRYVNRSEFGRDFEICCVLDATKRAPYLTDTKAFIDFANRNQDLQL